MNATRRQLYAMGEPLGDSATHHKPGCKPGARIYGGGGGGGSSSSSTTNNTYNTDARVAGGDDSTNVSINGNSNTPINLTNISTDNGAVAGALDLARTSITSSQTVASASMGTTKATFESALDGVTDAYSTAKAGDQKIVAIAGMAVVGLAAAAIIMRKG